jgi:predicted amidohydrolase
VKDTDALDCLLIQPEIHWANPEANRRQLEDIVRSEGQGCDLVIFPETFTSGFLGDNSGEPETMQGETVAWMGSLAKATDCTLCGSVSIQTDKGNFNRFLWAQPDGVIEHYDKRHLFSYGGEDQRYVAGEERKVFKHRGWRICPQVCYDLRFPVWCRNRGDYDLLLFVANWPEPRTAAWSALLRARAIENQCYVIGVNRSGKDGRGLTYSGASAIYDPLGEMVLDLGSVAGTGRYVVRMDTVKSIRAKLPFQQDADQFTLG